MPSAELDGLDRAAILYMTLPVAIFLLGWLEPWAGIPLILCLGYALKPLAVARRVAAGAAPRLAGWQVALAALVGCSWTLWGGTLHQVFANADWHLRDAVLHDLVTGTWPVGYGAERDGTRLLRAPIGYYLPAALIGKAAGLRAAHAALAAWTALGAALFVLQVLSRVPARVGAALASAAVIVSFSGLDVLGTVLRDPAAVAHWDVTRHLEWWAGRYQYSSMTTQLFWVPNHALAAWLAVGLMCRRSGAADSLLPMMVVAVSLWSPLAALGLVPFVLLRAWQDMALKRSWCWFHPRIWAPALAVGLVIAAYLTLDAARIPQGWAAFDLRDHVQFFLLEAGLVGAAILAIRRSAAVMLALGVLALLPLVRFGAANDLVMRASIPSLAVLAIGACLVLFTEAPRVTKIVLVALLLVGAVTPFQEFARAAILAPWPANLDATVIGAACGAFPAHYVARLENQPVAHVLRPPRALPLGPLDAGACRNPALMLERGRAEMAR